MEPYKEEVINRELEFPVEIFIHDSNVENATPKPHWHDCYEILYILEGSAEQQINNKFFKVRKNDLIIIGVGDIHCTFCCLETNTRILVIKFLPDIIDSLYPRPFESKYLQSFLNFKSENVYHLADTSLNFEAIYKLMMGLYEEFLQKKTGYEIFIKGYIYQMIACLIRDGILVVHNNAADPDLKRIDPLLKYIEKNYNTRIDLQKAASMLNLSCSYFSRYFKKITGRTFKEYLDYVRICEVEKMILSGAESISQAAFNAGFSDISSFNRIFKRVRGYPPGRIKKSKTAKK